MVCRPTNPKPLLRPLITNANAMMTSSNVNIFRVTVPLCGDFPAQRPVTRGFDVFFDLHPNKRFRKQSWGWWFETPSRLSWRQCYDIIFVGFQVRVRVRVRDSADESYISKEFCSLTLIPFTEENWSQGWFLRPANERRHYKVTPSFIGWAQT